MKSDIEDNSFPARITELLEEFKSTSNLARLIGVSHSVVRKWRDGMSDPSRENVVALAHATKVSVAWLAAGEGEKRPGSGAG